MSDPNCTGVGVRSFPALSYAMAPSEARAKQEIEKELTGAAAHWLEGTLPVLVVTNA